MIEASFNEADPRRPVSINIFGNVQYLTADEARRLLAGISEALTHAPDTCGACSAEIQKGAMQYEQMGIMAMPRCPQCGQNPFI